MRPVDRGAAPADYARYQAAGPDLQSRLGDYCSYCERQIETNLAVEHIQPKSLAPALETTWTNFLLGCVNCNSSKGDTPVNLADFFWPDSDNTLRAFDYVAGGLIRPSATLSPELQAKATATLTLTGLDKFPSNPGRAPTATDQRWRKRREVWQKAEWTREILVANNTSATRELIAAVAVGCGIFSIWWTVFAGDADMRRRFREAFPGTAGGCFDANEELLARAGGQL